MFKPIYESNIQVPEESQQKQIALENEDMLWIVENGRKTQKNSKLLEKSNKLS